MGTITRLQWVVAPGRNGLVFGPLFSQTVTRRALTKRVMLAAKLKQESVLLLTEQTTAIPVIPQSALAQEVANERNTCRNEDSGAYRPDNGAKTIKVMGYILVQ